MAGPGARKPTVGEGIESSQPLGCSAITNSLLFFSVSAPLLACLVIIRGEHTPKCPDVVHIIWLTDYRAFLCTMRGYSVLRIYYFPG